MGFGLSGHATLIFFLHALPNNLPVLAEMDREILTRPISKREVFKTLKSMPRGKSLGPDGINVEFYLFYWNQIGDYFFNAISYFFNSYHLHHSWGKTYVALIPKKSQSCFDYWF